MNRNEPLIIKPVSNGFILEHHSSDHDSGPFCKPDFIVFDDKDEMIEYLKLHYNDSVTAKDLLPPEEKAKKSTAREGK